MRRYEKDLNARRKCLSPTRAAWTMACTSALLLTTGGLPCRAAASGTVCLVNDSSEVIHLSNLGPCNTEPALHASAAPRRAQVPGLAMGAIQRDALSETVRRAAAAQRLDPALLHALIAVESGYAPRAVSPRGALGLMQLMPLTARSYGVTDAFDPDQNVLAGARHLRMLLDRFGQNLALALSAYNAGAGAVARARTGMPPFAETTHYVPAVLARYALLQRSTFIR